eukprot:2420737-Karenia_brevis.AAC.1
MQNMKAHCKIPEEDPDSDIDPDPWKEQCECKQHRWKQRPIVSYVRFTDELEAAPGAAMKSRA